MTSSPDIMSVRALEFTKESLKFQWQIARNIANSLQCSVYLYDAIDYFKDGELKTINALRYKEKEGKIGVLSQAAQNVLLNINEYRHFIDYEAHMDAVGLYIRI